MGGNAIGNSNRISNDVIKELFLKASKLLKIIGIEKFEPVGSYGKKDDYGDLDIAFESNLSLDTINDSLIELGFDTSMSSGFEIISFGLELNDTIYQVDLMKASNLELAKWTYYCPDRGTSNFSAKERSHLLKEKIKEKSIVVNDSIIKYYGLRSNKGLYLLEKETVSKTGRKLVNPKLISEKFISDLPEEICKITLNCTIEQTLSYEKLREL